MKLIEIMKDMDLFGSWQTAPGGGMVESIFTDKAEPHSYIQNFYESEFSKYQNKEINFLEIGIMSGGCFLMWKEYFKKAKQLLGVDCTDEYLHPECKDIEGVDYMFGDAYDAKFSETLSDFDIIIDDGSHHFDDQVKFIELYLPKLNPGGVLIVEDVAKPEHFETFIETAQRIVEDDDYEYEVECLDFRDSEVHARKGWSPPDDMMFVVRKS
jgi:SAM-dependent methyltransferase